MSLRRSKENLHIASAKGKKKNEPIVFVDIKNESESRTSLLLKFLLANEKRGVTFIEIQKEYEDNGFGIESMTLVAFLKKVMDGGYMYRKKDIIYVYYITDVGKNFIKEGKRRESVRIKKDETLEIPTRINDVDKERNNTSHSKKT